MAPVPVRCDPEDALGCSTPVSSPAHGQKWEHLQSVVFLIHPKTPGMGSCSLCQGSPVPVPSLLRAPGNLIQISFGRVSLEICGEGLFLPGIFSS